MTPDPTTQPQGGPARVPELAALFDDRARFEATVAALLQAGFSREDLSVLASHESLDAAGPPARVLKETLTALVGEMRYFGPLGAAGLIAIAGGPIVAPLAALLAAGIGGAAAKDFLDEVTARPHTQDFARALEAGGVILWVRLSEVPATEETARGILTEGGGRNVHRVERGQ